MQGDAAGTESNPVIFLMLMADLVYGGSNKKMHKAEDSWKASACFKTLTVLLRRVVVFCFESSRKMAL